MKEVLIELEDLKFSGDVLDISSPGNIAISEVVNCFIDRENEKLEKDYYKWPHDEIACTISGYNCAFAFFSLNNIYGKKKLDKLIKEVKKLLSPGGMIKIWEVNYPISKLVDKHKIKIRVNEDKTIRIPVKSYFNPFRVKHEDMVKILEGNSFIINTSKVTGDIYYIEASKATEVKNRDNEDSTCCT
jgi:hypothetical protein